jgi:hypothetical protein
MERRPPYGQVDDDLAAVDLPVPGPAVTTTASPPSATSSTPSAESPVP